MRTVVVAAVFCAIVSFRSAQAVPVTDIDRLSPVFDAASLVFAGQVVSVQSSGTLNGEWGGHSVKLDAFSATARVQRLYKGAAGHTVTITFVRPPGNACTVSECEALSANDFGLFFLLENRDGYHLMTGTYGALPVSRLHSAENAEGLPGLEADLLEGLKDPEVDRVLENIQMIGGIGQLHSVPRLLALLEGTQNDDVRSSLYVTLLKLHQYGKLGDALAFAQTMDTSSLVDSRFKYRIFDFVEAIHDPTTVPILLNFASSPSDRLRQSVIHALREIGSPEAVPAFVQALDDRVESVRYDAVLGLATIEKNWELAPSVDLFEKDEAKYIKAWKSWWTETGTKAN